MKIIETETDLRDWFLSFKLPREVASSQYAMTAWEKALSNPCKSSIWVFYVMSGMNMFIKQEISWGSF